MTEPEMIAAAQADKTQFVHLYDQHFDRIHRYLLTRVANADLAQDLTSQTFMKALESIHKYEDRGKPFSAWLYRIAINEMNQHFRRKKRERKQMEKEWLTLSEQWDHTDDAMKEKEDQAEHQLDLKELHSAFRQLKPKDQNLLSLRYFEDLSYQEIADVLGITVNNVGVRINRAHQRLSQFCNVTST